MAKKNYPIEFFYPIFFTPPRWVDAAFVWYRPPRMRGRPIKPHTSAQRAPRRGANGCADVRFWLVPQFSRWSSAHRRHLGQGSPCKPRFGTKTRCLRASSRTALLRDDFLCRASKVTSHPLRRSSFPKCKQFLGLHFGFLFSRYISRYENLKFGFLPFVVVTIVAMVFSSAVFAARAPAMGNSADRAWQLSQLVEGVLTACNPSHGSLSCVKTNSVSFASAQVRKLNHSVCFSFPHEVGYFVGTPTMAGHCVSKQIGRHDAACQGCPRCVSRSPEARCLRVFARTVRFSQPAVLSASLVIQLFGIVIPPIFLLKSTKRSAAAISRSQRSFITFHGALRIILLLAGFPATFHMITSEQTFVNGPLQKIFTC